jgi:xanthine dehydrogenase accessory factor
MRAWLPALLDILARGEAAMLVHVAALRGSGPREAGAQMLVAEGGIAGTIGGGELERAAILAAREFLRTNRSGVLDLALGPELNQCCGGAVTLAFEAFAPADRAWVEKLCRAAAEPTPLFRTVRFDGAGRFRRDVSRGGEGEDFSAEVGTPSRKDERQATSPSRDAARSLVIRERLNPSRDAVWLFGAGHVGRAVVNALVPLGFDLVWIDGRAGQFPDPAPSGVRTLSLAMPELIVDEAPPGAFFLVMTHSHPLDEAICEAVLRRGDFAYLGLIGSKTKRARFVRQLGEAGIDGRLLSRLTCPIGLAEIRSKEPAAIAAGVAADLLMRRDARQQARQEQADHGR